MNRLKVAIVGCGSLAERGLLPHLHLEPERVEVTALCDTSEERLRHLSETHHISETYSDLTDCLNTSNAQAVAISTPIQIHHEQAREALQAGRHVYVQKTMAETGEEARDLIRMARARGLTLAASPDQMALPAYLRARDIVGKGTLGRIFMAIGINLAGGHELDPFLSELPGQADPAWYYRSGGGPLRDMGVYSLHAITGILGPAQRVLSLSNRPLEERQWAGKRFPVEVDDNVIVIMELKERRLASVCAAYSTDPAYLHWGHLAISGSGGALEVRRLSESDSRYELLTRLARETTLDVERFGTGLHERHDAIPEAHVAVDVLDFVDSVLNTRPPLASAEHACHVIDIIEAAEKAAETGSVCDVPEAPSRLSEA